MMTHDTIVAISSPPGNAMRGIIRLSGPLAHNLALRVVQPHMESRPRRWIDSTLRDPPCPSALLLFEAPASFTGQHIAEIHLPGSPILLDMVLEQLIHAGARPAEPGEFTARAFFNGKFDLTRAEGIAATIAARNRRQLRAAGSLRHGELFRWTQRCAEELADLLALVEAGIDFSDEPDITFISADALTTKLRDIQSRVADLLGSAVRWETLDTLPGVILLGRANVGKSSLLNALAGHDRAIVSAQAGTTRDAISVTLQSPSGLFRLFDVAGVDEDTSLLAQGMNKSRRATLGDVDVICLVTDRSEDPTALLQLIPEDIVWSKEQIIFIRNKCDLPDIPPDGIAQANFPAIAVSARTGENLDRLRDMIAHAIDHSPAMAEGRIAINIRHRSLLDQARAALVRADELSQQSTLVMTAELMASELRLTLDALGEISGAISPDELLGRIFSRFCIGK